MTDVDDLALTLRSLASAFDQAGLDWAVGGSLASTAYGEPRATNDIDVVAAVTTDALSPLVAELRSNFYADLDMAREAAARGSCFNLIDERTFLKVDVFLPHAGPMGRGQLERRRALELMPGVWVPVLGPEDTVLQKLKWFVATGETSDRQWRDMLSVVRAASLDRAFIDERARTAGLSVPLARLYAEAARND